MPREKATIYLDADIRTATKLAAAARRTSESEVVEQALRSYLQTDEAVRARESLRGLMDRMAQRIEADSSLQLTDDEAMVVANEAKQWARQQERE